MSIKRFLDSDQRPNVEAITASQAHVKIRVDESIGKEFIDYKGVLGAIQGDHNYVGFTGVELSGDIVEKYCNSSSSGFIIAFKKLPPLNLMMTIQLVIQETEHINNYSLDFKPSLTSQFKSEEFKQTVRGRYLSNVYKGQGELLAIRFFFKRSINDPVGTEPIDVSFQLPINDVNIDS